MRYMLMLRADKDTEAGVMPSAELVEGMGKLMEEMAAAGVLLGGEGLQPSSKGKRLKFADGKVTEVIDGPFAETKELIAGYAIMQADSFDEVMKWAERFAAVQRNGETEIRPLYSEADFSDVMTPEMQAREAALREELQAKSSRQ